MECLQYCCTIKHQTSFEQSVLNLVINGMPSIRYNFVIVQTQTVLSFKPCYKWNAFNTKKYQKCNFRKNKGFKPCYKWNAFNTKMSVDKMTDVICEVLNLVINGMPSIRLTQLIKSSTFSVLNLVINGMPSILNGIQRVQTHYQKQF